MGGREEIYFSEITCFSLALENLRGSISHTNEMTDKGVGHIGKKSHEGFGAEEASEFFLGILS